MQIAKGISFPVEADSVLSPQVLYGEPATGIYFITDDDQHVRLTFESFDSMRVCRGEYLPYEDNWTEDDPYYWVSLVENSEWLKERYEYESENYGSAYEWGGDVDEMLTDFKHYIFTFHDQFVEVIAKGVWFETDSESLFGKELPAGHPFLKLSAKDCMKIEAHGLVCQVRINPLDEERLKENAFYCSQKLMEFALELEGRASVNHTLKLSYKSGKLVSSLGASFGKDVLVVDGVASLKDVQDHIEEYMKGVAERRRQMGK